MNKKTKNFGFFQFDSYDISILLILVACFSFFFSIFISKVIKTDFYGSATVIGVGNKGITVEYHESEYGQKTTEKVNVDDVSEYSVGDTVTLKIHFLKTSIEQLENG